MVSSGFYSLLYSVAKKPLEFWSKQYSETGRIKKILDLDLLENVIEIQDLYKPNNSNTFIVSPGSTNQFLDIALPILILIIKNMNVECRFKVQISDTEQNRHYFHFSNEPSSIPKKQTPSKINHVQFKLTPGWNRLEIDFGELTQRAFQSTYKNTQRLAIYANCRIRRIYFVARRYNDTEIQAELCRAFFNHYIVKRGIYLTPKSEFENQNGSNNSQFLKWLEIKAGILINEYSNRSEKWSNHVDEFRSEIARIFSHNPRLRKKLRTSERETQKLPFRN